MLIVSGWDSFGSDVETARRLLDRCIDVVDANARVGSVESPAVGPVAAEEESVICSFLHEWMLHLGLRALSAFEASCADGPQWTWLSPLDSVHRIDYVLLGESWLGGMSDAEVRHGVCIAVSTRTDNVPASADLSLSACQSSGRA